MSRKNYIIMVILPTLVLVMTCAKRENPSVDSPTPPAQMGITRIAQLFDPAAEHPLIGFIDSRSSTVYVAPGTEERVKKLFHVREDKGATWVIDFAKARGEFKVMSMEQLDRNRLIDASDVYARGNLFCQTYKQGTCINFFFDDGRFAFSWIATTDVGLCITSAGDCVDLPQTNQVTLFPGKDCKGRGVPQQETFFFCVPA